MPNPEKLTTFSRFSGCGAKLGPGLLDRALCGLSQPDYPEVLADFGGSEDAGVYKISDDTALVQTIDFFPPISDDPVAFGEIAAANSLSDVYAMGGRPVSAVNVLCYPEDQLPVEYLRKIMEGAMNKLTEAGAALLGGHSVSDRELKFGFCINGLVHPDRIIRNNSPRPGDVLVLTKALGSGTINTALRGEIASPEAVEASERGMRTLNRRAAEIMGEMDPSACTDVTGFGLAGHAAEMALDSGCDLIIRPTDLPVLPSALDYLAMGLVPEGTYRNKEYRLKTVENAEAVSPEVLDLLFDPQTSGGLLCALPEDQAKELCRRLAAEGEKAAIIGSIAKGTGRIRLDA